LDFKKKNINSCKINNVKIILPGYNTYEMRKTIFLICTLSIAFIGISTFAQEKSDTWDFPVKPGTQEWKNLGENHATMIKACQIPEESLNSISAKNLVKICLDYPLFGDFSAFNTIQRGFDIMSSRFNGFDELYTREDAGTELLEVYKSLKADGFEKDWTDLQKGKLIYKVFYLELLLAQEEVLLKYSEKDLDELLEECIKKIDTKKKAEIYSTFSIVTTPLIMGRVLKMIKYQPY